MILIKAVAKHVQDFLSRISKPGRLAYVSVSLYISSSCRWGFDIVPIKGLSKKLNCLRTFNRYYISTKDWNTTKHTSSRQAVWETR